MLQRIQPAKKLPALPIAEAAYPAPFAPGLEYSPAARGTWNIVHTGMLLPESHQIYICAAGCLRGVVLTAAEMGDAYRRRFSALELHEDDLYRTDHETFLIEGITDILRRLPRLPRAVLVFTACVHHFLGCNLRYVYRTLRERFPSVAFAECVMDPIRQTKSLTPEERERREIYRLLPSGRERNPRLVNLIGSNLALTAKSDIKEIAHACGRELLDLTECHSYDDFLRMGEASENLYTNPFTHVAARDLLRRLGQDALFLPQVWRYEEICDALTQLAAFLGGSCPDLRPRIAACELALDALHGQIGAQPIAIDFTFTFLPMSLARLLVSPGFHVTEIYADAISRDDEENFHWLQQHAPDILLYPTKHPAMRRKPRMQADGAPPLLALGQKAAYFTGTRYFLPVVEGGGHYGLEAITWLAAAMSRAALLPQNTEQIIRRKGWGGPSCLS